MASQKRKPRVNNNIPPAALAEKEQSNPKPQQTQVVRFRTSFANTVFDVMKNRGWLQTDSEHVSFFFLFLKVFVLCIDLSK
jgi:hypothetical protein